MQTNNSSRVTKSKSKKSSTAKLMEQATYAGEFDFRASPVMHAVVRDAWNAGLRADMKLDLAPIPSIMNKVYNLNLKTSL